jgi:hypothetical protein
MTNPANCNPPTERVRDLLGSILRQAGLPGSDELLRQASSVNVGGGPVTMLDLHIGSGTPASAFPDGPLPLSAEVSDVAGALVGELLIWVDRGYLSALEFAWWTDEAPEELPTPERVRVARK